MVMGAYFGVNYSGFEFWLYIECMGNEAGHYYILWNIKKNIKFKVNNYEF